MHRAASNLPAPPLRVNQDAGCRAGGIVDEEDILSPRHLSATIVRVAIKAAPWFTLDDSILVRPRHGESPCEGLRSPRERDTGNELQQVYVAHWYSVQLDSDAAFEGG